MNAWEKDNSSAELASNVCGKVLRLSPSYSFTESAKPGFPVITARAHKPPGSSLSLVQYRGLLTGAGCDSGAGEFELGAIRKPAASSLGRYGIRRVQALGDTRAGGPEPGAIREPAGSSSGRYGIRRAQALGDTGAGGFQLWAIREPAGSSLGRYDSRRVPALGDTGFGGFKPGAIREPVETSLGRHASIPGSPGAGMRQGPSVLPSAVMAPPLGNGGPPL